MFHSNCSSGETVVHDTVVLSFHESLLRQSDVELLNGNHWLNDTLISFYFEYLEKIYFKDYQKLLFVPPQVTQCIKLVQIDNISEIKIFLDPLEVTERDFIFFALNDNATTKAGGTHWSLLVFSRPEKQLFHFDSSAGMNHNQAWELGTRLTSALGIGATGQFEEAKTLQQNNGYDCGLHLICNAENVAEYVIKHGCVNGAPTISSVDAKRKELLQLIEQLRQQGFVLKD